MSDSWEEYLCLPAVLIRTMSTGTDHIQTGNSSLRFSLVHETHSSDDIKSTNHCVPLLSYSKLQRILDRLSLDLALMMEASAI